MWQILKDNVTNDFETFLEFESSTQNHKVGAQNTRRIKIVCYQMLQKWKIPMLGGYYKHLKKKPNATMGRVLTMVGDKLTGGSGDGRRRVREESW